MLSEMGVQTDLLAAAGIMVTAFVLATVLITLRRTFEARLARPHLPPEDRPPAGLSRLVPIGAQVEVECRRGVVAIEHWLLSRRQAGPGGA